MFSQSQPEPTPLRAATRADETEIAQRLAHEARVGPEALDRIATKAKGLVEQVRLNRRGEGGIDEEAKAGGHASLMSLQDELVGE